MKSGENKTRKDEMIEMRKSGMTLREISALCGVTTQRVSCITRGSTPLYSQPKIARRDEEIKNLYASGIGIDEIIERMGMRRETVYKKIGIEIKQTFPDKRFWDKVEIICGQCWKWKGHKTPTGYGTIRRRGKHEYAHRVSYTIHYGPIPVGMVVMHKCDNPECTNPEHLQLGTQADNVHDREIKGRGRYSKRVIANPGR